MIGYGSVLQKPYRFQDDILIPVDSLDHVRTANVKVDIVMKMMQTKLIEDKSGYILMGPQEQVEEARKRVMKNPIMCGEFKMKELEKEKWLGDQFTGSLKQSVIATIKDREGKVRRAAYEIVNIVEDYRAQRVGGFLTALQLWESCVIPSLLYNCSCWVGMGKEEEKTLGDCQDFFLRLALATGPGASKVALRADFGIRSMAVRVYKEKVLLVLHIRSLEDSALAKMMWREQLDNNWPGLAKEAKEICKTIGVEDVNVTTINNAKYTKIVEEACRAKDETEMKKEMLEKVEKKNREGSWSKLKRMVMEDCSLKDYVKTGNIFSVRKTWEARAYMLKVAGNYRGSKMYESSGWLCQACGSGVREDQDHLGHCSGYSDLLQGRDLASDRELVEFYALVMARRKARRWD